MATAFTFSGRKLCANRKMNIFRRRRIIKVRTPDNLKIKRYKFIDIFSIGFEI